MEQTDPVVSSQPITRKGISLFLATPILAWALYDFANTIFSSNIVTIFFPFYMKQAIGGSETLNNLAQTFIAYTNAISSFFLVVLSPLFGVWIDRTGKKKAFLVPFTLLAVFSTAMMGLSALWNSNSALFQIPLSLVGVLLFFMFAKFFYNSSLMQPPSLVFQTESFLFCIWYQL